MARSSSRAGDRDVVEHGQVLDQLAQPDAAGVRAHRDAELGGQQQDRDVLVDPGDPARVDLQHVDRVGLQQLLEHHPVGDVLAGGHRDRPPSGAARQRLPDGRVAEHVVRAGRLLDPRRVVRRQRAHPGDRVGDVPALVGVDRDPDVRADRGPGQGESAQVVVEVGADLQLDLGEAVGDRLAGQPDAASRRSTRASPATSCTPGSRSARVRGPLGPAGSRGRGCPAPRPG